MTDELKSLALRILAGVLVVLGLVAMIAGYLGVRDQADVVLQLPYAISGGIGGLGLILVGAILLIYGQMREQTQAAANVIDSLEEWKEAALAEVRSFLDDATIEVEVLDPERVNGSTPARPRRETSAR